MISIVSFNPNRKVCFCTEPEKIENYDKAVVDETQIWACHHRLETHNSDGERRLVNISKEELQALGMYYNRPASELIFMMPGEHSSLHNDQGLNSHSDGYSKIYYEKHRDERLTKSRAYHKLNKEKISNRKKAYHETNKSKLSEQYKKYRSRKCIYKGKELTFGTLRKKLKKEGFEHPAIEAAKYLIQKEGDSQ